MHHAAGLKQFSPDTRPKDGEESLRETCLIEIESQIDYTKVDIPSVIKSFEDGAKKALKNFYKPDHLFFCTHLMLAIEASRCKRSYEAFEKYSKDRTQLAYLDEAITEARKAFEGRGSSVEWKELVQISRYFKSMLLERYKANRCFKDLEEAVQVEAVSGPAVPGSGWPQLDLEYARSRHYADVENATAVSVDDLKEAESHLRSVVARYEGNNPYLPRMPGYDLQKLVKWRNELRYLRFFLHVRSSIETKQGASEIANHLRDAISDGQKMLNDNSFLNGKKDLIQKSVDDCQKRLKQVQS